MLLFLHLASQERYIFKKIVIRQKQLGLKLLRTEIAIGVSIGHDEALKAKTFQ
jgi:hypothetical protein